MRFGVMGNAKARIAVCSIILLSPLLCYASDNYDLYFSSQIERRWGHELSEEGVRTALEHFDGLDYDQACAEIAVVGEQRYVGLVDELKAIYHRRPEDVQPTQAYRYRGGAKYIYQAHIARALILCGDDEAEKIALEVVMRTPEMSIVPAQYAVRNLKYLVKHVGTDLSNTFEFLIDQHANLTDRAPYWRLVKTELIGELREIERYTRMTNHPTASNYAAFIRRYSESAPADVRAYVERVMTYRSRWVDNQILEKAQAEAARPAP